MPSTTLLIATIDASLGRVDYDALSDQARMELLIAGMPESFKKRIQDSQGYFRDVCKWPKDRCVHIGCDGEHVTRIKVNKVSFTDKQFPFDMIPPRTERFSIQRSGLRGTLDTSVLPQFLSFFSVHCNDLHGSINFIHFPRGIQTLEISHNNFSGSIALADLPDALNGFYASANNFSGELSLRDLPAAMQTFYVDDNKLNGELHIDRLPPRVETLVMDKNRFTGEFRLMDIPARLCVVDLASNALNGTIVLGEVGKRKPFQCLCDKVRTVIDSNGDMHPWEKHIRSEAR